LKQLNLVASNGC